MKSIRTITALLLCCLMLSAMPAMAEDRTISVVGSATVFLEADQAELNLGVQIKDDNLSKAQSECAERIAAVIAALEKAEVEKKDIATADYSIYSYTESYTPGVETQKYQVNHLLSITVRDISRVGDLIDQAVRAGANAVNNISFTSSKVSEAYTQAMQEAVRDAQSKAQILCGAAGVSLGSLQSIDFSGTGLGAASNSRVYKAAGAMMDAAASTVIQSGSISVSASVTVVYAIGNE